MADIAESAVLVSSAAATAAFAKMKRIQGPNSDFHNAQHILNHYPSLGFQASNFGHACHIAEAMLRLQAPSKVYQIKDGKYVLVRHDAEEEEEEESAHTAQEKHDGEAKSEGVASTEKDTKAEKAKRLRESYVYPTLFLGITANLMGTGCREAVRFLVQEGVAPHPMAQATEEEGEKNGGVPQLPDDASEDQLMFARLKQEYRETYGARPLADEAAATFRSFVSAIVVSGGGVEHDVRRACATYTVGHYASEEVTHAAANFKRQQKRQQNQKAVAAAAAAAAAPKDESRPQAATAATEAAQFGNITYPPQGSEGSALFDAVMQLFVERLCARQQRLRAAAAAKPVPEKYLDVCSWSVTPSEVWALLGLWLVDLLSEAMHAHKHQRQPHAAASASSITAEKEKERVEAEGSATEGAVDPACRAAALEKARSTVVYWAAVQQVPIYSPSFVDGDIAAYLLPPPGPTAGAENDSASVVQLDLVRDIHSINKLAMQSKKTGMLICGGGVVKHHICNANLMRNGADYTVILNNGQEFDGSDAGAKPEEALSWGKVRMEGEFVKVYGEVTTYLPLLVARVFVPAVRRRSRQNPSVLSAARVALRRAREASGDGVESSESRSGKRARRRARRQAEEAEKKKEEEEEEVKKRMATDDSTVAAVSAQALDPVVEEDKD